MAGLLDFLNPQDPAKQQGLLAAAAALLEAGGPSRFPVSTGQGLAAALGAYQKDFQSAQDRQQQQSLYDIKLNDAQSDLSNQDYIRQQKRAIADAIAKLRKPTDGVMDAGDSAPMASVMPGGAMSPKAGGPDWMQNYQQQAGGAMQVAPLAPAGAAPRANRTDAWAQNALQVAQVYYENGDIDSANKLMEQVQKLRPKYNTTFQRALSADGKMRYYQASDDGAPPRELDLGVAPDLTEVDLNDRKRFVDKNSIAPGTEFRKGQSPDSLAADRRAVADRATGGAEPSLNDQTLDFLAGQALRGDTSVYQNLGRGAQGAANLVALRTRVAQKAHGQGLSGADLASIGADYQGQKAGLRTSGNISARVENAIAEADQLAPLAVAAGRDVTRSGLLPFGKAQIMFDTKTNDPALKKFVTANNGLVSAYAGAMARGQKPTVSDYDHAREILSAAQSQDAYEATVQQMQLEMKAASAAPKAVRQHLRNEISGQGSDHGETAPNPAAAPATGGRKVATLSDIAATARASGKSTKQVTADLRAAGYTIGGQ